MVPLAVGLTGGIGSGKTTVAQHFARLGAGVIDTDAIAHALTAPEGAALPALQAVFGPDILDVHGALDRPKMRARVFADAGARRQLEAVLHPLIRDQAESQAQALATTHAYLLWVVPLLVESGDWRDRVQRILVIDCSEATQIRRVVQRNGLTTEEVRAVMTAQATRLQRLQAADDVLVNEYDIQAPLALQVENLHRHYVAFAAARP